MSALPTGEPEPDEPTMALLRKLAADVPITKLISIWTERAGFKDGKPGRITIELVIDTQTGKVRDSFIHQKKTPDQLDQMGDAA